MKKIINRIYNDYFMKNRFKEYEKLITDLIDSKYKFMRICDCNLLNNNKSVFLRHDIDSDVKIAKRMFEIEKKYNIKATYYFRKTTFDLNFINEIVNYGSEVGYHYEELATYCKKNRINDSKMVFKHISEIKSDLINNLKNFEVETNIKLRSIAAHGDFINRKIGLGNTILFDEELRNKFPNIIEAYDDEVEAKLDARISDCCYSQFWKPISPDIAIKEGKKNILILVHTRWWSRNPLERFKNDINRIIESIKN